MPNSVGRAKQRLITASTLAMGQKIIILDEPLANLDKDGAAMLMGTLRSLAKAGYCIIVIEHRLDMAAALRRHGLAHRNKTVRKVGNRTGVSCSADGKNRGQLPCVYGAVSRLSSSENVAFSVKKEREFLKDITLEIPKGRQNGFSRRKRLRKNHSYAPDCKII